VATLEHMTIVEAIKAVLEDSGKPLTAKELYNAIVAQNLYDFKAKEPVGVVNGQIRRRCVGLDFPSASPVKFFKIVEGNRYALKDAPEANAPPAPEEESDKLPEEKIEEAYEQHLTELKQQLLDTILRSDFAFFERLVIDLLVKMGYGGTNPDAGLHTGKTGDGGIDGVIKQDELGLELIYIQAKRYALNRKVREEEVRSFAGALNKVRKGVFLTTSEFTAGAQRLARDHEKTIILVNGDMLAQLMVNHGVGLSEVKVYRTMKIDQDYFSEVG
jgi:restriction system protein